MHIYIYIVCMYIYTHIYNMYIYIYIFILDIYSLRRLATRLELSLFQVQPVARSDNMAYITTLILPF